MLELLPFLLFYLDFETMRKGEDIVVTTEDVKAIFRFYKDISDGIVIDLRSEWGEGSFQGAIEIKWIIY